MVQSNPYVKANLFTILAEMTSMFSSSRMKDIFVNVSSAIDDIRGPLHSIKRLFPKMDIIKGIFHVRNNTGR